MGKNAMRRMATPWGRASFVHIVPPYGPKKDFNGIDTYEVELLFDKANLQLAQDANMAPMMAAVNEVIAEQWPKGAPAMTYPIRDGDTVPCSQSDPMLKSDKYPIYKAKWFIKVNSKVPVIVWDRTCQNQLTTDEEFYAGCICVVDMNICAYDNINKGVGLYINQIQFVDYGERLGGGQTNDPAFFKALPALPPAQMPEGQQQAPLPVNQYPQPGQGVAPAPAPQQYAQPPQTAPQQGQAPPAPVLQPMQTAPQQQSPQPGPGQSVQQQGSPPQAPGSRQ